MISPEIVPTREITTKLEKTFLVFSSVAVGLFLEWDAMLQHQHSTHTAYMNQVREVFSCLYSAIARCRSESSIARSAIDRR